VETDTLTPNFGAEEGPFRQSPSANSAAAYQHTTERGKVSQVHSKRASMCYKFINILDAFFPGFVMIAEFF
jgi:hypothetical protein